MKLTWKRRYAPALLLIVVVAAALPPELVAAEARASEGGMSGMEGMSAEEMQNMTAPAPAPSAATASAPGSQDATHRESGDDGHSSSTVMDPDMAMGAGSANWFVVGGFVALIAGATVAAAATKRHLRRRMLAGELAGAGARDA